MHSAARSTPLLVNVKKLVAQSVLTHTCVDKAIYEQQLMLHLLCKWNSQIWYYVVCFLGKGLGLILARGLLSGG